MKRRVLLLLGIVVVAALVSWFASRRWSATEDVRADIQAHVPIGTSRAKVDEFLHTSGLEWGVAEFDYPDERAGKLIFGETPLSPFLDRVHHLVRFLPVSRIHFAFYFDRKGPNGKLVRCQVSDKPIPIAPP